MKYHPSLRHGLLAISLGLAALPAWASDDCDAPVNRWQTREALRQWASAQGWQIQRLKIDDGCYEIRGTDAQGRTFKAKIDPETLKVLKMKQEDPQRARARDRDDEGAARHTLPPQPDGAAVPAPLSAPGSAPRGQIE
ncbi:MAG: PepSY domain-containing protein [Comamonadaceae bacterium]|nr:PepSY domain-containing protein [Comamonadaceae bacterium]